jgi:hypothetical protein
VAGKAAPTRRTSLATSSSARFAIPKNISELVARKVGSPKEAHPHLDIGQAPQSRDKLPMP